MAAFYYDTSEKLREIFTEHCNLSFEQYQEISMRLFNLASEAKALKEKKGKEFFLNVALEEADDLNVIFEFLLNTEELTLEEYNDLSNLVNEIVDDIHTMQEVT